MKSLAILSKTSPNRDVTPWTNKGDLIRRHIGMEDTGDLIADLEAVFARVAADGARSEP